MKRIHEISPRLGVLPMCDAFGIPRSSYYRWLTPKRGKKKRRSPRALSPKERQEVLDVLHDVCFVDLSPAEIIAKLLDLGIYHCSVRTMYRILTECEEVRERRNQLRHPHYQKPELLATRPNELWSWILRNY